MSFGDLHHGACFRVRPEGNCMEMLPTRAVVCCIFSKWEQQRLFGETHMLPLYWLVWRTSATASIFQPLLGCSAQVEAVPPPPPALTRACPNTETPCFRTFGPFFEPSFLRF